VLFAGQVLAHFERSQIPVVLIAKSKILDMDKLSVQCNPKRGSTFPSRMEILEDLLNNMHAGRWMAELNLAPKDRSGPRKNPFPALGKGSGPQKECGGQGQSPPS